jgi:hypothetical protein
MSEVSSATEELIEKIEWIPSASMSAALAMLLDSFVAVLIIDFP